MKTQKILILIVTLSLLIVSCKKSSPTPAPVNNATTATATLTPTETALLGNWCHDKAEVYSNGVLLTPGGTVYYNDCSVYHIQFNSTVKASPVDPTGSYRECIDGRGGSDNLDCWQITTSGKLYIGGIAHTIETLTSTYLCYYYGSLTTGSAVKYIFHKI